MAARRSLFWIVFLGGAGVLALIPEFFPAPADVVVRPLAPSTASPLRAQGQLAELRTPAAAPPVPSRDAPLQAEPVHAEPERQAAPRADLFAAHSWYVAPPPPPPAPPPAPVAPPPPMAPPLPFAFLGKLQEPERLRVFLVRGERAYTVSEGDVLDGAYRVERVTDTQISLTYLPLNQTQTLALGSRP